MKIIEVNQVRYLFFLILLISCKKSYKDTNLDGRWDLIHIYNSDYEGDLLKNDSSQFVMIVDDIVIDKHGGFIMSLLSMEQQVKGKLIEIDENKLIIENATNKMFNGVYNYEIIISNDVVYLNLESDGVIVNARRNTVIINSPSE